MTEKFYYAPSIRDYIKQDLLRYGYHFDGVDNIELSYNKNLILYETDIKSCIHNIEKFQNNKKYIIIIDHHYVFHTALLKLDSLIKDTKFILLGTQYLKPLYKNLECLSLGSSEDWCRHDFIKYLVDNWWQNKKTKIEKKFLLLSAKSHNSSHQERNKAIDHLHSVLGNDILSLPHDKNQTELMQDKIEFDQWMIKTFGGQNMLGGFGNGLPRFDLYDQIKYEIVLETIYSTDTIHLSEKTWRPIACGVPAVFLLNRSNLEHLEFLGYRLEPKPFYDGLKNINNLNDAIDWLKKYSPNFTEDYSSKSNCNHFWRFKSTWGDYVPALTAVFGYCKVQELMKKLKEI